MFLLNGKNRDKVDRVVTYNYLDSSAKQPIWTTGSLDRTALQDSSVFNRPHATYYTPSDNDSFDVTGNTDGSTIYYEHEIGTNQVNAGGAVTAIQADILSGDFDITQKRSNTGQAVGTPDLRGDGEYIIRISRFFNITQNTRYIFSILLKIFDRYIVFIFHC